MHVKPKLQCTRDYDLFDAHEINRSRHEDAVLMASMREVGFMPSSALQCQRLAGGRLKIIRGHHRFAFAKSLGLPVWYIVDESNTNLYQLEGTRQGWSVRDFADSRASGGDVDCAKVLAFQKAHGLTLGAACSLVGGESAGSQNKVKAIKNGTFHAALDQAHAKAVAAVTDRCREAGVGFATASAFVSAVSLAIRVPEFDSALFLHRVTINGGQMTKRSTVDAYLKELDALYNYQAKGKRIPLAFRAREVSRQRQVTYGKQPIAKKAKG